MHRPRISATFSSVFLGLLVAGCSSGTSSSNPTPTPTPTPAPAVTDVYVAGAIAQADGNTEVATIWKNGVATSLASNAVTSSACCVVVLGSDVYVGGRENDGAKDRAVIWKNGTPTFLTDGTRAASVDGMAASSSDVYAVGTQLNAAMTEEVAELWKNGVVTDLPDRGMGASALGIAVAGADVYASGYARDLSGGLDAGFLALWKNGELTFPIGEKISAAANGVAIDGADVYLAGSATLTPMGLGNAAYWKNGTLIQLSTQPGQVYAMAEADQTTYVAGAVSAFDGTSNRATLWKNAVAADYSGGRTDGLSFVTGLTLVNGSLYASGQISRVAVYWKDGVQTVLGDETGKVGSTALGIAVVQH